MVAGIIGQGGAEFGKQRVAGLAEEGLRSVAGHDDFGYPVTPRHLDNARVTHRYIECDPDVFERIAESANEEIAAQGARQADSPARAHFVVKTLQTVIGEIAVIEVHAKRELAAKEPRLDERSQVILALRADLDPQPEFLAAPREGGWMKQIEIGLAHLGETDNRIHRTKPCAQRKVAGVFLIHPDDEVLAALHVARLGSSIDFLEKLQTLEAVLADFDAQHVEGFTGRNGQLPTNDPVAGFDVSMNFDFLNGELLGLVNAKFEVHGSGVGIGDAHHAQIGGAGGDVDVAFGAVKIFDRHRIRAETFGGKGVADIHGQAVRSQFVAPAANGGDDAHAIGEVRRAEGLVAGEFDRANLVLGAFVNMKAHDHRPGSRVENFDALFPLLQFEVNEAVIAIKLGQLVAVLLH